MYILQSYTRLLLSFHYSCIKYTRLASNRVTMATTVTIKGGWCTMILFYSLCLFHIQRLSRNALKMPILVSRGGTIVRAKDELSALYQSSYAVQC